MGPRWVGLLLIEAACSGGGDDDEPRADEDIVPFAVHDANVPEMPAEEVAGPDVPEGTAEELTFEEIRADDVLGGDAGGLDTPANRELALMARPGEECALSAYPM